THPLRARWRWSVRACELDPTGEAVGRIRGSPTSKRAPGDRGPEVRAPVPATTPPGNVASFPRLATRLVASKAVTSGRRRADAAPSTSPATIRGSRRRWAAKDPHRQPSWRSDRRCQVAAKFDFGAALWRCCGPPRQRPAVNDEEDVSAEQSSA